MKEIDFLPEWYKSGMRRQVNYRVQYIILSGVFAVMMVWNFVTANSISEARAKYMEMETKQSQSGNVSAKLQDFIKEITELHEKEILLNSTGSKIIVSNVLAEISYLVDERIVLSRVELISEKIPDKQNNEKVSQSSSVVRPAGLLPGNNTDIQLGDVRFRVLITGAAANGSDVAALLCKLEDSPYFSQVNLAYSRDAQVKIGNNSPVNPQEDNVKIPPISQKGNIKTEDNIRINEFEINCFLSNYRQQK